MKRLESMKEQLISCVEGQIANLQDVDAHELGEAIDMIKDLEEAMYYCSIVKAMEEKGEEENASRMYYSERYPWYFDREIKRDRKEREYPTEMRDYREGSSPIQRKYYMESKELHHDKTMQMHELEKYMQELSKDITEMIQDASPEETTLLKQKLATLVEKIK